MAKGLVPWSNGNVNTLFSLILLFLLILCTALTVFLPSYSSTNLTTKTTETKQGDLLITDINPDAPLRGNQTLMVIGTNKDIDKCFQ